MKLRVYSIYDEKSELFARPSFLAKDGQAMRGFGDAVGDPQSDLHKHYKDFSLYQLAEFDDETGKFVNEDIPKLLCRGSEFIKPMVEPNTLNIKSAEKEEIKEISKKLKEIDNETREKKSTNEVPKK